jgi:hypothetical protein
VPPTKPEQDLKRDLQGIAFNLEQTFVDLGALALLLLRMPIP